MVKMNNILTKIKDKLNQIKYKNYVDLIPSRVHRKPVNKFRMQSQVKQIKRTHLKQGGESENKKMVANG